MIAYVVRCDVCGAEAFVPLNQDPDMCMSARGWRMRPLADVPERVSTRLNRGDREGV